MSSIAHRTTRSKARTNNATLNPGIPPVVRASGRRKKKEEAAPDAAEDTPPNVAPEAGSPSTLVPPAARSTSPPAPPNTASSTNVEATLPEADVTPQELVTSPQPPKPTTPAVGLPDTPDQMTGVVATAPAELLHVPVPPPATPEEESIEPLTAGSPADAWDSRMHIPKEPADWKERFKATMQPSAAEESLRNALQLPPAPPLRSSPLAGPSRPAEALNFLLQLPRQTLPPSLPPALRPSLPVAPPPPAQTQTLPLSLAPALPPNLPVAPPPPVETKRINFAKMSSQPKRRKAPAGSEAPAARVASPAPSSPPTPRPTTPPSPPRVSYAEYRKTMKERLGQRRDARLSPPSPSLGSRAGSPNSAPETSSPPHRNASPLAPDTWSSPDRNVSPPTPDKLFPPHPASPSRRLRTRPAPAPSEFIVEDDAFASDASEDNFSETENAKVKALLRERELFSGSRDLRLPEEEDADNEEDFEWEAEDDEELNRLSGKRHMDGEEPVMKKNKGKGKAVSSAPKGAPSSATTRKKQSKTTADTATDAGNDEEGEEEVGGRYKLGPVDKQSQEALLQWKEEYEEKVEALALEINKPSSLLWEFIEGAPKDVRNMSAWNMFERWLYAPTGGKQVHDKDLPKPDWGRLDRARYNAFLDEFDLSAEERKDTKVVLDKLPWLQEWHDDLAEKVREGRSEQGIGRDIAALTKQCTRMSDRAWKEANLHVIGFVVCTAGGSRSFGASKAFKLLKERHLGESKKTLKEYESRLHVLELEIAGASAAAIMKSKKERETEWPSLTAYENVTKKRDAGRKFVKDGLVIDIVAIQVDRGLLTVAKAATATPQIKWASWEDYAYEHHVRLENWDDDMASRGAFPKSGFTLTKFSEKDLECILPGMERRHGLPPVKDEDEDEHQELVDCALRIVPWTEAEIELPLMKQGRVAVITTVNGTSLSSVQASAKFTQAAEKARTQSKKAAEKAAAKSRAPTVVLTPPPGARIVGHVGNLTALRNRSVSQSRRAPVAGPSRKTARPPLVAHHDSTSPERAPAPKRVRRDNDAGTRPRHPSVHRHEQRGRSISREPPPPAKRTRPDPADADAPKAGEKMSRMEKNALLARTADYLKDDEEEERAAKIKFKIVVDGEDSPIFYGRLIKCLGEHNSAQKRTWFWDANINSEPGVKPGKIGWVYGTKSIFFEKRKEKWLLYGYIGDNEDLEKDMDDPPDEAANVVKHVVARTKDTDNPEAAYYGRLRVRIGVWYREQYSRLLKEDKAAFAELFTGALDQVPPKPMRPKITQYYSSKFYNERIKDRLAARWASMERRATLSGEKLEAKIKVTADVTKEIWEEETQEFCEEVEAALERDYQAALKAWEASLADSPTKTPRSLQRKSLANAAFYLQPYVNAIQERFGMCASLLLCGPIGKKGGAIGVQSVHAGMTRGVAPVTWPFFDVQGFREAEKSMIAFAKEHFSEADCKARALPGTSASSSLPGAPAIPPAVTLAPNATVTAPVNPPATTPESPVIPCADSSEPPDAANPTIGAASVASAAPGSEKPGEADDMDVNDDMGENGGTNGADAQAAAEQAAAEQAAAEDRELQKKIEEMWKRDDHAEWTPELARAHASFERGKGWGIGWAAAVSNFFDFEAACGYGTEGSQISTKGRPQAVKDWIARARNWTTLPKIGRVRTQGLVGTFARDWWAWWKALQPDEHVVDTTPSEADWSKMTKLHGNDGLLQVMAALLWWGDCVAREEDPFVKNGCGKKRSRPAAAQDESRKKQKTLSSHAEVAPVDEGPRRGRSGGAVLDAANARSTRKRR
ncbi:hypothetical protein FB451DRAFT_1416690 [Mycena latifolia]|nr:hypothetical protein FB451DRAFT_1416690 [Mycena latifolia]